MRKVININNGWRFLQKEVPMPQLLPADWPTVDLPHTWNAVDGHDGNGGYNRGSYWYAREFETPPPAPSRGPGLYTDSCRRAGGRGLGERPKGLRA